MRALLIDDSELDAELLVAHLERNGYDVESRRVESADGLRAALAAGDWDIVLCDYVMPRFSGPEALAMLRAEVPDLPVIVVSGQIGEEYPVDVMRAGAVDYVNKNNLSRLVPAVERELAETEDRRQRRRLESALQVSEERLRAAEHRALELTEHIPVGTYTIQLGPGDQPVRFTFLSDRWLEMIGRTRGEVLADPYTAFLVVHPEDLDEFVRRNVQVLADRARFFWEGRMVVRGETRWCSVESVPRDLPDGSTIWEGVVIDITERKESEAALQASEARLRDAQKRLQEHIGTVRAELEGRISEAMAQLRVSEERLTLAFRASQDGLWDWSMETGEVWYSPRWGEMLGYTEAEVRPHVSTWENVLHPDDRARVGEAVDAVMRGERGYDIEFRVRHKDGHYLTVQSRGYPVRREPGGPIVRIVGTHHDITDLKHAEASLRAAVEELEAFNHAISHDLRAPLRHISGFVEALIEDFGAMLPPEAARYLAHVRNGCRRLSQMVDALLQLSRAGGAPMHRRQIDLSELVKAVWADLGAGRVDREVELAVGALPEVCADPVLLRQVLDNLLGNALKFTQPVAKARIEVGHVRSGTEDAFFVRDNGVGFDPARADQLFGVFQRLHAAGEFEGTGVGLSIVKRIVEKHGGRVWAESAPGKGATFYFTIP